MGHLGYASLPTKWGLSPLLLNISSNPSFMFDNLETIKFNMSVEKNYRITK